MTSAAWGPRRPGSALLAAFLCLTVLAAPAAAHDQTFSYSTWTIDGDSAEVVVRLSHLEASRFQGEGGDDAAERRLAGYLVERVGLLAGGRPCRPTTPAQRIADSAQWIVFRWRLACPSASDLEIRSDLLVDVAPSHLHFARVRLDGGPAVERVLSESERSWRVRDESRASSAVGDSLTAYVRLGVEHILTGYDHLAFIAALLLIGGSLAETAKIVTGFTVAHSITLGLAVLGHLQPERAPIEALIGLSIAIVAAENLWLAGGKRIAVHLLLAAVLASLAVAAFAGEGRIPPLTLLGIAVFTPCYLELVRRARNAVPLRAAIAFLFGLVHGFGFAGVLMEAELPAARLGQALFGFNAGVEIGQLAVVVLLWPVLRFFATRRASIHTAIVDVASSAVLALGVFWFVSRAFL